MDYTSQILSAILTLTFASAFFPNIAHATTFNQGTRHIDLTPQGGVAVSDNGGNATTSDHSVAVAHGNGSDSDASGHSTAVSNAQGNSLAISDALDHGTANSNAQDKGIAISAADDHSTTDATTSKGTTALAIATNHQTSVVHTP